MIAAADTFRAAAEEQLDIWSKRAGAEIVRRDKADPASVVYEAIEKAQNGGSQSLTSKDRVKGPPVKPADYSIKARKKL